MIIQINGQPHEFDSGTNLKEALNRIGFGDKPVVIEHNKEAILARNYDSVFLAHGDTLEIITISAGG